MPDYPDPNLTLNPVGTPYDKPATADDLGPGGDGGVTLFSLWKGILLQLIALNESAGNGTGG